VTVSRLKPRVIILYFFFLLILLPINLTSQDHSDWSYNLGLYEVNIRQYTVEGTFAAFKPHLARLKEMGVGILWFMPIHPIGIEKRLGSLGSYYSVKDYLDINPEFGTLDDFKSLVTKAHEMGFYVLIDWVANHTSWDNPLTISNPEWYTKDQHGNFMPPAGTNWSDVIDLDYSNQGLRDYMIDAMKFWITETGIDGFRFDAASMVPLDFWESAITELKEAKPEILMLAEADGPEYQQAGFDMSFAWGLYGFGYGVFTQIINGIVYPANIINSYLRAELNNYSAEHYRLYFTSNHDENSWYGTVFERFGDAAENFAAITHTINGMPLIYSGQEAGLNKRLKFFDKDFILWNEHPYFEVYKTLLNLKRENSALWNGLNGSKAVRVLTNNNPAIFAFVRQKDDDKVFALFNITDTLQNVIPVGELYKGKYVDVFSGDTVSFSDVSEIELSSWGYKIFKQNSDITGINEQENIIADYILEQNYPNPFNPTTKIRYSIPRSSHVSITVYDILGKHVETLVDHQHSSGVYEIEFNATDLSSGVYFYRMKSDNRIITNKLLLIR